MTPNCEDLLLAQRPHRRHAMIAVAVAIIIASMARASEENSPTPIDQTLVGDAAIADIFFIDLARGWAVGERGVIWHTTDGGANWQQQRSTVSCSLTSLSFIDARRGWAVGGACLPYGDATRGVVLRTEDGGQTWAPIPDLTLPRLRRVKFFDAQNGVALGDGAPLAPSGVLVTRDGGRNWKPLTADAIGGWLCGDFLSHEAGAVAGAAGRFATVLERRVVHSPLATASLRSMHAMRLVAPAGGWLVGDGGLVLTTRDLGHSWQSPTGALPAYVSKHFDLHAVAVHENNVWVAGSPGTRVLHSPDGGATWHAFATNHHAPLRAITFIDKRNGWAAGELGAVLRTEDGGRNWKLQRAGGKRAALLALVPRCDDLPPEICAEQGAKEGFLPAVEAIFTTPHADSNDQADAAARMREAAILAGATSFDSAWRFPLSSTETFASPPDVIAALNSVTDGRALEQLEEHLVRKLRLWRPEVVVTRHSAAEDGDPPAALVEQLVLRAVEAAAHPSRHPELTTHAGLGPWQVKKVYGLLPQGVHGDEVVSPGRFVPRLGGTLHDWTEPARRILQSTSSAPSDPIELVLLKNYLDDASSSGANGRGLFAGVSLSHGGEARRPPPTRPPDDVEELRRLATRRRHLRELLSRTEGNAAWAAQVASLLEGLNEEAAGSLLDQLAGEYRRAGQLDLAADTYYQLARRCPDHPLTDRALIWLVQFYASSEAGLRAANRQPTEVRQAGAITGNEAHAVEQAGAAVTLPTATLDAPELSCDERLNRAVQLGDYLKSARPALFVEPSVRFAIVAAQRKLGFANPAKRYFLTLDEPPENDPWRRCASTEQWLANPGDLPPAKTLGAARRAAQRPHLDGRFDEPCWEVAERLPLGGERNHRAGVRLMYDDEFLYIAIDCAKLPSIKYEHDAGPRPRDADLSQHDRITLCFDVDRDYTTHFEFTVDHRGWTRDMLWGDASWNPTWYVAAFDDGAQWSIEAAISIAELVAEPPAARHVWAVSACRTVPGGGESSWTGAPLSGESPEQYGLLIFE